MAWISVKEKLPTIYKDILIRYELYGKIYIDTAYRNEEYYIWAFGCCCDCPIDETKNIITHWCYVPEITPEHNGMDPQCVENCPNYKNII